MRHGRKDITLDMRNLTYSIECVDIAENKITFFATNPGGRLARGLWGDPPEIDNARFYENNEQSSSPYVYVTQKMEWDPAVLWTKASALFMPVLFNPNSLFIGTVQQ